MRGGRLIGLLSNEGFSEQCSLGNRKPFAKPKSPGGGDVAAKVAVADVDVYVRRQLPVLGPDRGRPARRRDLRRFAERNGALVTQ
jgi:hypothetical protein